MDSPEVKHLPYSLEKVWERPRGLEEEILVLWLEEILELWLQEILVLWLAAKMSVSFT